MDEKDKFYYIFIRLRMFGAKENVNSISVTNCKRWWRKGLISLILNILRNHLWLAQQYIYFFNTFLHLQTKLWKANACDLSRPKQKYMFDMFRLGS